jgi:V/A-type H+-transporting ATPase subunit K
MAVEGLAAASAALSIGVSAIATAYAQAKIASAGLGALAEDDDLFGSVLILVAIPETIVIFGLVVSLVLAGLI